jgi:beta-N-acetylhexosaminidase
MKIFIILFFSFFLLLSCSSPTDTEDISLETKIGQMLLIGFRGLEITEESPIAQDIINGRVGGVVLFDYDVALQSSVRNIQSPEQVKNLTNTLQSLSRNELFIAVDQEGGKVCRLKEKYGFPPTVSQQYLGDLDDPDTTAYYAGQTALTLKDNGFNVNFAPVVDLNVNPDNPVIGAIGRSFSSDPKIVTDNAMIVIEKLHNSDLLSTLKHFPGHGSSTSDSHQGFVDVTNTWSAVELIPYQNIINAGAVDFIMTAHIFNSNWDANYPATLSKNVITGILREQLGYQGVVISDDMNMKAITDFYGLEQALMLSINAGVDIIVFGNNLIYDEEIASKAIAIIKMLVENGEIRKDRIDEAYERIVKMKTKLKGLSI